ncbi:hypothetical protein RMR10_004450 [Agrobacterium rosae]|uniref:hypothetical protein n=1 Tax=Agrobacterium rosae TaxID=1972867 RepID=UPI002A184EA2|nr:hypothetical protein [Agrobacterium rosae]MDX8315628.1 hypothetical protein [Agrobacterium rosae]
MQEETREAIARGDAQAHALWVLLSNETDRDGFWLKPLEWEGSGEYQRVSFRDGRNGFVKTGEQGFKIAKPALDFTL